MLQVAGPRLTLILLVGVQVALALVATMNVAIRQARPLVEMQPGE